jgi:L-cysteine:1D-myo-inositol 2-amino-2-deoxy-alpha-D-glucopyranoside ligase
MIGLDGEKMSKSKGNLVLVSKLIERGVDPMAIRYALMKHHYRHDQMWSEEILFSAEQALSRLRTVLGSEQVSSTTTVTEKIMHALASDLDTPAALDAIDNWVDESFDGGSGGDTKEFKQTLDSLLGLAL